MCGITGMVRGAGSEPVDPERLRAMCRTLSHRGPDDEGMYVRGDVGLAARRLAVVDVAGGSQPVRNEAGTVHAVLNGEIYNHAQLRRQLMRQGHRFEASSDSEVIPHLYEEYGSEFAERLEGMFAIAVWDESARQLVLCRDRAGIKPMYYAAGAGLVFGSEIRAILASDLATTLDTQALSDYLSLMYIPGPRTMYREIRKLEPAAVLVWRANHHTIRRYWSLAGTPRRDDLSAAKAQETLVALLADSVERQLMSDVPLGFFLSGGLDSSSVVAAARRARPDAVLRTFTVGFSDQSYDERREAAEVARHLRTSHTEAVIEPRASDVVDRIAPIFDEPFADPSIVPTYYLCEQARQQVTVALSGDGGDELFAGYLSYWADKVARHYRKLPRGLTGRLAPALLRFIPTSHARSRLDFKARRFIENALDDPRRSHYLWRVVFRENHKAELLNPDLFAELTDSYATHEPHDLAGADFDTLTRFQYTDANVYLVDDVLTKADRVSMAHSLEVRVPLLATSMIEFAFSLPDRLKMPGYKTKWLFRRAMADALPARTSTMTKKGFNAPLPRWLAGPFRPLVREYLSKEVLRRQGFLQFERVNALVNRHMDGVAENAREIWTLLMLSLWAESHPGHR
ncbi:asparagine synthase (glutamine-hydrolyzing) [Rugosimonospora acidiphila]|uniref:asparagine synthase (glutamine-hydrolyzing) n=1 Tax=Rugosimonospora acidiphila TaxID=556531 RepID=A0ABP9RRM2_9ACTN